MIKKKIFELNKLNEFYSNCYSESENFFDFEKVFQLSHSKEQESGQNQFNDKKVF